jgi:hypothetical protein
MSAPSDIDGRIGVLHFDRVLGFLLAEGSLYISEMWHWYYLLFKLTLVCVAALTADGLQR